MEDIVALFEVYLLTQRRAPSNTAYAYLHDVKQYAAFLEKKKSSLYASDLNDAKAFLHHLKANGMSARSMSRKISSLKVFFNWAQEMHRWHNYTVDLVFPRLPKKLPTYLTNQEVEELLDVASKDESDLGVRNKTMVYLLYVSGMRISELTSLTCSNIHENDYITVEGKGNKQRIIPMTTMMFDLLHDYLATAHKKFTQLHGETDYLFPTVYGGTIKSISRQACWIILRDLCKKTSIDRPISPHQLRHSLATHLLRNGADLRSLQLLLGHETISTVEIYTHLDTGYIRSIYDKKHPRS
jgi:integrase/recombinase XerD